MLIDFNIALAAAVVGFVYSGILTLPEHLLANLDYHASRLPWWAYKPLIGCAKCVTGQIALWYLVAVGAWRQPIELICTVCAAILITTFLEIIYEQIEAT